MGKRVVYPDYVRQAVLQGAAKAGSNTALLAAKHSVHISTVKRWIGEAGISMKDPRVHPDSVRKACIKDYISGLTVAAIHEKRKVSPSSVLTWLKDAKVEIRNNTYVAKHSIVDGKKACACCKEWKPADYAHFYRKTKSSTLLSSYCIPCCVSNAVARGKSKREYKKRIKEAKLAELHSRNIQSRTLLAETADLLRKLEQTTDHHIDTLQKLLSEINSFFSRGRLLKIP